MYDGDRVVVAGLQCVLQHLGRMDFTVRHLERRGIEAVGKCDSVKAVAERAVDQRENARARAVANGPLHESGCRRARDEDGSCRTKNILESGLHAGYELFHLADAMADHRLQHGLQNFGTHFRWTWQEKPPKISRGCRHYRSM